MKKTLLWFAVVLFLASVPASVFADGNPDPGGGMPKKPTGNLVIK